MRRSVHKRSQVPSKEYLETHKDEITALQVLYSQPYAKRLTFRDIKELADAIHTLPRAWELLSRVVYGGLTRRPVQPECHP